MTRNSFRLALALGVVAALAAGGCDDAAQSKKGGPAASAPASKQGPKIAVIEPSHDFGKVKQGKEVVHIFKVRNTGTTPLLIQKARGS